jgi:RNA polymerase sigma-70 factor (ECF subfamily)
MDRENRSMQSLPADGPLPIADRLLLEQIRAGDPDAGHRFIQEHYPGVYRYLLYLTGNPEAAADLTQETFLQAWRRLDTFNGRSALRTWLHRIARREFLQALRSQRQLPAEQRAMVSLEEAGEIPEPGAAERTATVELRAIIGKLPLEEREMVVLHYLEGYPYEEIASLLGIPVSRVRYRLSEPRARLRRELGEGDLTYRNQAPKAVLRHWAWLPLEALTALAARLSLGSGGWLNDAPEASRKGKHGKSNAIAPIWTSRPTTRWPARRRRRRRRSPSWRRSVARAGAPSRCISG